MLMRRCSISLLGGLGYLLPIVTGHMEMKTPFPIGSKFDPQNTGATVDYNMMRPMMDTGADYPCLGNHLDRPSHITATYAAGSTYDLEIVGEAVHGGGSCQLSLSYDNGQTFHVIKSIMGSCPIQRNYKFTIPADTPAGKDVLFAWTWFNKMGNREMYMNCARVEITNGGMAKRQLINTPEIFKANVFGGGSCVVQEGTEVVFAHPGPEVEYGNPELQNMEPTNVNGCPAINPGSAPAPSEKKIEAPSAPEPARIMAPIAVPLADPVPSTTTVVVGPTLTVHTSIDRPTYTTTVVPPPAPTTHAPSGFTTIVQPAPFPPSQMCDENSILCTDNGSTWMKCAHGNYVNMGRVAAGTICRNGEIGRDSEIQGKCVDGEMQCHGTTYWAVCSNNVWVDMGAVAAGTVCQNGRLGPA
ncbi:hypothetical protein EDC01DRAFT_642009 [Geopyxis carbonaria]|nr:hypothetical protein EDC01DRAFT_642009 [Geopyxis carbonaria]